MICVLSLRLVGARVFPNEPVSLGLTRRLITTGLYLSNSGCNSAHPNGFPTNVSIPTESAMSLLASSEFADIPMIGRRLFLSKAARPMDKWSLSELRALARVLRAACFGDIVGDAQTDVSTDAGDEQSVPP
jgi:hypothetical protein